MRTPTSRFHALPLVLGLLWGCTGGERPPTARTGSTAPAEDPAPEVQASPAELRLVVLTDLQGYLEPCGCQKVPLGGIDRAAQKLATLGADGVPQVLVSVGDLLVEAADAHALPEGAETQERWKAEVLAGILGRLGLAAALPGPADARFGAAFRDAQLSATGARVLTPDAPHALVGPAGKQVGVFGLRLGEDADPAAAAGQVARWSAALRETGAEVVVGLVEADVRGARRLAGVEAGADVIVVGGRHRDDPSPPLPVGRTTVLTGAQHGRGLLVVDLVLSGEGPLPDGSAWTVDARREQQQARIADLEARIADWEKQPDVDPAQLARQRERLHALRAEVADMAPPRLQGRHLRASFVPLDPEVEQDAKIRKAMLEYDRRVNTHNRKAFAGLRPPPAPPGTARYVGSARCAGCHAAAAEWWEGHAHGRAYATLQTRHKEFNLSCVGCHVTGYQQPGGSTVTHVEGLTNVGCESCHGPGSLHPQQPGKIVRAPGESTCTTCHNSEHSDAFEFSAYRARLIAPGHGLPAEKAK